MKKWLSKLIPQNIAGILGALQVLIPLLRELIVISLRIIAVFRPGDNEIAIKAVVAFFNGLEKGYEKLKDFFLKAGG